MKIEEVPPPALREGFVLVANMFSLISPGTERATMDLAQASLFSKAQKRPDLVKQVLENIRREGLLATFKKVDTKLDSLKALGYSSSGIVIDSKDFGAKFRKGMCVACGGQDYASHAEIVCVPQNLVVRIPESLSQAQGAFATMGAIALQGVRQAQAALGENVCVVGLGLLGQITAQILKANGCKVCGIDFSEFALQKARAAGVHCALNRNDDNIINLAEDFTHGLGFDKVIITASSAGNDPLILAAHLARKKGVLVLVGDVKINVERALLYPKELELKMATSYGPGRYDPMYEEAGVDYPYSYVRFTENRNMQDFIDLVASRAVNVDILTTNIFDFERAREAYELIGGKKRSECMGVLLKYSEFKPAAQVKINLNFKPAKTINAGFIGAGSFAQGYILPHLRRLNLSLDTVVNTTGPGARRAAEKFGFNNISSSVVDVFGNKDINTVFIATRHDTHADFILRALEAGQHIFVEKPLCLNVTELESIAHSYRGQTRLMVGFNRRFAPLSRMVKEKLTTASPLVMNFRVNAGYIAPEHWVRQAHIGGGRIVGEVCHFIDLMSYFCAHAPRRVYASCVSGDRSKHNGADNLSVVIDFSDGSLGTIIYSDMGSNAQSKERLEIFSGGTSFVIDDFRSLEIYSRGRKKRILAPGKGHAQELESFLRAVHGEGPDPIEFESILLTTLVTFKITESLKTKKVLDVDAGQIR